MEKSENLEDKAKCKIVVEELNKFNKLVGGHKKLLLEIGRL